MDWNGRPLAVLGHQKSKMSRQVAAICSVYAAVLCCCRKGDAPVTFPKTRAGGGLMSCMRLVLDETSSCCLADEGSLALRVTEFALACIAERYVHEQCMEGQDICRPVPLILCRFSLLFPMRREKRLSRSAAAGVTVTAREAAVRTLGDDAVQDPQTEDGWTVQTSTLRCRDASS